MAASPALERLAPAAFRVGNVVSGKYRIERPIAEGGFGVVVLATHLQLERYVAIKYLRPEALADRAVVERFAREARLTARIQSEHVVRVHDVGSVPNAGPYIVMEYVVGKDLGQLLEGGPLLVDQAVDYIVQACDALAEAHALRIVHRDLKPQNMLLAERPAHAPILKIIDFGISKIAPRRGEDGDWSMSTGNNAGTPVYMSPEQLDGDVKVDLRADIWSLGVTLHEMLAGSLPFRGQTIARQCTSILTQPPARLTELRADVPVEVEAIVLACLEKSPARRIQSVVELAQRLAPFGPPGTAERATRMARVARERGAEIPIEVELTPAPDPQRAAATFVIKRPMRRRELATIVLAGAAAVAVVALFALAIVRALSSDAGGTPALAATRSESAPVAVEVASPPPQPSAIAPPPPLVRVSAPSAPKPARQAPKVAPAPSSERPALSAPAASAPEPGEVNPRAQFGERK